MKREILKTIKVVGIVLLAITAIFTILVVVAGTITPLLVKKEDEEDYDFDCCSFLDDLDDEEI